MIHHQDITDGFGEDEAAGGEDIVIGKSLNADDARFDHIIGCIEEIIMDPKFQDMQEKFMLKNYKHFDDETDENRLIYTSIHKEYVNLIEKYLESQLQKRVERFSMEEFMRDLMRRRDELDGEIFEILLTFEDFIEFKQLMLSYKAAKEGKSLDLSMGLCIQSLSYDASKSTSSASASNNSNRNQHHHSSSSSSSNNNNNNNNNHRGGSSGAAASRHGAAAATSSSSSTASGARNSSSLSATATTTTKSASSTTATKKDTPLLDRAHLHDQDDDEEAE